MFNLILLIVMAGSTFMALQDVKWRMQTTRIVDPELKLEAGMYVNGSQTRTEIDRLLQGSGWLEELDADRRVIRVQGRKQDEVQQYSEKELYELLSNRNGQAYYYSVAALENRGDSQYLLLKLPRNYVNINVNDSLREPGFYVPVFYYLAFWIILMLLLIFFYSAWVARRIRRPLHQISQGLKRMVDGNYSTRISLDAEQEFVQIREAFNYMGDVIENTLAEKRHAEESKQRLIVDLSHDLKTPITSIQGYAQALLEGRVEERERQVKYMSYIYRKSAQVTRLIHNMLDFLKIDSPDYVIRLEQSEIGDFLREVVADVYGDIEQKKFVLQLYIPDQPIYAVYDAELLSSVIQNLIGNALTYNPPETRLRVQLIPAETEVIIEIADTGIGIPKPLWNTIFDPFVRKDEARTGEVGTGLGLSIAKKNTEKMGGTLELRDQGQEVTVFTIRLRRKLDEQPRLNRR
ncbi:HAMP domain-containing sensor histidine kinase [Paenibacillus sp. y28]